ncbi:MAG: glycosyltransferase family 1 protein, partial [Muribaculaceae bacterium]|nr:glycosyltransferase family 1 protein [Muribaculaceae bacterium]
VVEGLTGEYIDLSAESINNGIKNMMKGVKRPEYGENGRKWVTSNYDWTVMWPKIAAFYSSLKQ